jgi:hypothetical protein
LKARTYVNPPGGRALYDPAAFATRGLNLRYLSAYSSPFATMLQALAGMNRAALRDHLKAESALKR